MSTMRELSLTNAMGDNFSLKRTSDRVLLQLIHNIHKSVAQVDDFIQVNGLPEPSFDASYPPLLQLSPEADTARNAALEALDELRAHLLGPVGVVMSSISDMTMLTGPHGLARFNIPEALPADGTPITISDLAMKTGMNINDTKTLVRHACSQRLINHHPGDEVSHCSASKAMLFLPDIAGTFATAATITKSAQHVADVMDRWPGTQNLHQSAYSLAHNTDLPFFDHLASEPVRAKHFADTMALLTSTPALSHDFVFAYDWTPHAEGTVVDIGGSHGNIAFPLASKFPNMEIIVQDRPEIVATAPVDKIPNVSFKEHDLFSPQPIHGADVYFMRFILHDWPDAHCVRILRALVPALRSGARLVIMDGIVPEPGVVSKLHERRIMGYDMVMKTLFNAKERTEVEWRELMSKADDEGRFKIVEVLQPKGSQLGFVVIEWAG